MKYERKYSCGTVQNHWKINTVATFGLQIRFCERFFLVCHPAAIPDLFKLDKTIPLNNI